MIRLRIIAIAAPIAFAITLGVFTEEALQPWLSAHEAHIMATAILTCGVIIFTFGIFGVLENMQAEIDSHRERESQRVVELARMAERERIGLALHDGVIQDVYGVQLKLDGCLSETAPSELASCLNSSIDELTLIIGKMREYIFSLRPYLDGENDLSRALSDLLADAEANSGTSTELEIDDEAVTLVKGGDAAVLFQLANEAVASAISRGATQVTASVSSNDHTVRLEVADNGQAFKREIRNSRSDPILTREPQALITVSGAAGRNVMVASLPVVAPR